MAFRTPTMFKKNIETSDLNLSSSSLSVSLEDSPDSLEASNPLKSQVLQKPVPPMNLSPIPQLQNIQTKSRIRTLREPKDSLDNVRNALLSEYRGKEEALLLYKHLENTDFFKEFKNPNGQDLQEIEALLYACQNIQYEKVCVSKVIFEESEKSQGKTYFILDGEINIVVKNPKEYINNKVYLKAETQQISDMALKYSSNTNNDSSSSRSGSLTPVKIPGLDSKNNMDEDFESFLLKGVCHTENGESDGTHLKLSDRSTSREKHLESPNLDKKLSSLLINRPKLSTAAQSTATRNKSNSETRMKPSLGELYEAFFSNSKVQRTDTRKVSRKHGTVIARLKKGDHFGAPICRSRVNTTTAVAKTECEFIVLTDELYNSIRKRLKTANSQKLDFMMDYFPGMETIRNVSVLYDLLISSNDMHFDFNSYVTVQGGATKLAYMLHEGTCNLYLKLPEDQQYNEMRQFGDQEDQNKQDGILICKLSPGMIIGEEVLFNPDRRYEFTVKAASNNVNLFAINLSKMTHELPQNVVKGLYKLYKTKRHHYFSFATYRIKLKMSILPKMKPPSFRKNRLSEGSSHSKIDISRPVNTSRDLTPSPPRDILANREKFSSYLRVSSLFKHQENKNGDILRSQILLNTKFPCDNSLRRKLFAQVSENRNISNNDIKNVKLDFGHEAKRNSHSRSREKSSSVEQKETKSVDNKRDVPKLNLQNLDTNQKKPVLTMEILKRLRKSQSRGIRKNAENISFSMATDRSSKIIPTDETTRYFESERSIKGYYSDRRTVNNSNQIKGSNESNQVFLTERSNHSPQLEQIVMENYPPKQKKETLVHRKYHALTSAAKNYGPNHINSIRPEKKGLTLKNLHLEAGFMSGLDFSNQQLQYNSERKAY